MYTLPIFPYFIRKARLAGSYMKSTSMVKWNFITDPPYFRRPKTLEIRPEPSSQRVVALGVILQFVPTVDATTWIDKE